MQGEDTTLGLLTEFFANSADGWAMATSSVRDLMSEGDLRADEVGGDFAAESHRLGEAVAAVHADLARAFGTTVAHHSELSKILDQMVTDAEVAINLVPELAEHREDILATFARAGDHAAGLNVQRIHGDLHLGQVLRTLSGWSIIDFEGEPSKPLAYRRALHSPLKDIAGMLRSFDYVARGLVINPHTDAQHKYRAAEWAERNRRSFSDGYASVAGNDPRQAVSLLRAFELDKALYEVVYEHGHRPRGSHPHAGRCRPHQRRRNLVTTKNTPDPAPAAEAPAAAADAPAAPAAPTKATRTRKPAAAKTTAAKTAAAKAPAKTAAAKTTAAKTTAAKTTAAKAPAKPRAKAAADASCGRRTGYRHRDRRTVGGFQGAGVGQCQGPAGHRHPAGQRGGRGTSHDVTKPGGVTTTHDASAPDAAQPSTPAGPSTDEYEKLIGGDTHDPHGILGAHPTGDGLGMVRTLRHHAKSVTLLMGGEETPFTHTHGGVFTAVFDGPVGESQTSTRARPLTH